MIDISNGIKAVLHKNKKLFPQHVNRISSLDDPCLRRLYYLRHDWDKQAPTDDGLQGVFETGKTLEPVIERIVSEVGMANTPRWRIVGNQMTTNDAMLKEYQIRGTIDGLMQIEGLEGWKTVGVIDIKTMSANTFNNVNTYDDLNRYEWTRKYRGQLMLYAIAHNLDQCFILCVNKNNLYDMKIIDFPVDLEYCDRLLSKAKAVNEAIASETAPAGVNDYKTCSKCGFQSFCCPAIQTPGSDMQIIDNAELAEILERMEDLEPYADEYGELEKALEKIVAKGQNIICGNFMIQWKAGERNYKAQPAKDAYKITTWTKDIVKLTV